MKSNAPAIFRQAPAICLLLALLFSIVSAAPTTANAQEGGEVKVGVIDMQECLTSYWRTDRETETLNELAKEKRQLLDDRNADYMQLNKLIAEQDKIARATELPADQRNAAIAKLQELLQERAAKQTEIQEFQRRIQAEMMQARTEMEATLVEQAKEIVASVAEEAGLDLVHDRSFLPRANKAVVYISGDVPDITQAVIAKLNADAPPPSPDDAEGDAGTSTTTDAGGAAATGESGN